MRHCVALISTMPWLHLGSALTYEERGWCLRATSHDASASSSYLQPARRPLTPSVPRTDGGHTDGCVYMSFTRSKVPRCVPPGGAWVYVAHGQGGTDLATAPTWEPCSVALRQTGACQILAYKGPLAQKRSPKALLLCAVDPPPLQPTQARLHATAGALSLRTTLARRPQR